MALVVVETAAVATAAVEIVAGAGDAVAGRMRRRSGCPAQSWAAWCSRCGGVGGSGGVALPSMPAQPLHGPHTRTRSRAAATAATASAAVPAPAAPNPPSLTLFPLYPHTPQQGKIKSLESIYLFSMPVKEYQIVEYFLGSALKDEVMKIMPVQKQTRAGQRTRFKVRVLCCGVWCEGRARSSGRNQRAAG